MHGNDIIFDVENTKIGIAKANCIDYHEQGQELSSSILQFSQQSSENTSIISSSDQVGNFMEESSKISENTSIETITNSSEAQSISSSSSKIEASNNNSDNQNLSIILSNLSNPKWFISTTHSCRHKNYSVMISILKALSILSLMLASVMIVGALFFRLKKRFLFFEYFPDGPDDQIGNLGDSENVAN